MGEYVKGTSEFGQEVGYREGYTDGARLAAGLCLKFVPESEKARIYEWLDQVVAWRGPIGQLATAPSIDFVVPPQPERNAN